MEVLVLMDFEGTLGDELTIRTGDVVKNITKGSEEGWLEGDLRGKRGIFPASFVKEVPLYLTGNSKMEPRSIRTTKKIKQVRTCEVVFPYNPMNCDELQLVVGETVEILSEIEDGWWMGIKNGRVGAFPSNFVQEIFVSPKDSKHNDSKVRPKLSDAIFSKEKASQRATVRSKAKNVVECCQVMFDYKAKAEDELDLKTGDVVVLLRKETEDDGWWEGELNGRCGFFPDNFVMVIPPVDSLKAGKNSLPPTRNITKIISATEEGPTMDKGVPTKAKVTVEGPIMDKAVPIKAKATEEGATMDKAVIIKAKDDKNELKDMRSNPPTKVKLPSINKVSPPAIKDKPAKPAKANSDVPPTPPKAPDQKDSNHFDAVDMDSDKLNHPTVNRAKPPQRRPPSGAVIGAQTPSDSEPEPTKKVQNDKLPDLQKGSEQVKLLPAKPDKQPKTPSPVRPSPPQAVVDGKKVVDKDKVTLESLQADIKDLRMALELLQTRHEHDMQEVKEELKEERTKRLALQEEVQTLRLKF